MTGAPRGLPFPWAKMATEAFLFLLLLLLLQVCQVCASDLASSKIGGANLAGRAGQGLEVRVLPPRPCGPPPDLRFTPFPMYVPAQGVVEISLCWGNFLDGPILQAWRNAVFVDSHLRMWPRHLISLACQFPACPV